MTGIHGGPGSEGLSFPAKVGCNEVLQTELLKQQKFIVSLFKAEKSEIKLVSSEG